MPIAALCVLLAVQAVSAAVMPVSVWQAALEHTLRPRILDAAGLLVGFEPPTGGTDLEAAFAADPGPVPAHCIELALASEDAHHSSPWRRVRGVDLGSVVRAAMRQGGASTISMQLSRQLAPHWQREYPGIVRKVLEASAAAQIESLHGGNVRAVTRSYLAVAPFGGAFGDVRGIAAAADALWGLPPEALSQAQCAALVALLPVRISLVPEHTKAADVLWQRRMAVAQRLLSRAGLPGHAAAADELARWPTLPRRPAIAGLGEAAQVNLGARTRAWVLPHLGRLRDDAPAAPGAELLASKATARGDGQ